MKIFNLWAWGIWFQNDTIPIWGNLAYNDGDGTDYGFYWFTVNGTYIMHIYDPTNKEIANITGIIENASFIANYTLPDNAMPGNYTITAIAYTDIEGTNNTDIKYSDFTVQNITKLKEDLIRTAKEIPTNSPLVLLILLSLIPILHKKKTHF